VENETKGEISDFSLMQFPVSCKGRQILLELGLWVIHVIKPKGRAE
jgi:hypothetical protein